jgi:hypothetical protein
MAYFWLISGHLPEVKEKTIKIIRENRRYVDRYSNLKPPGWKSKVLLPKRTCFMLLHLGCTRVNAIYSRISVIDPSADDSKMKLYSCQKCLCCMKLQKLYVIDCFTVQLTT